MSMIFDKAFNELLGIEGGYVDDPSDSGGKTRYGITEQVARDHGYNGSMRDLPVGLAKAIYKESYWDKNKLDDISLYSEKIAYEIFDSGVNCGTHKAAKWLQRAINCFRKESIIMDGRIGPATIEALRALDRHNDKRDVLVLLNGFQAWHYSEIALLNPKNKRFFRGWMRRVKIGTEKVSIEARPKFPIIELIIKLLKGK